MHGQSGNQSNKELGMTDEFRKEAYRRFWLVKGHLVSYMERRGHNHLCTIHILEDYGIMNLGCLDIYEEGFEEAYEVLNVDEKRKFQD